MFLQITFPGGSSSTLGNFAVFSKRASPAILIPAVIVPPRYTPSFETAQNVVAVPKSTIINGPPYLSYAATAFTILSVPTCLGLSVLITIPVFIPGPTNITVFLKYFNAIC